MDTSGLAHKPWLLLPGTLCTGRVFDGFLQILGVGDAQRTLVQLDRPSVADYHQVFEDIADDTVICGFSLGAIVAAHAADRIAAHSLIVFGLNPFADDPAKAASRRALAQDVERHGGAAALASRAPAVFGTAPDDTLNVIYPMADETAHLIEPQTQLAVSRPGALPALAQAKTPVLSLTGSLDLSAPAKQGSAAAQASPNGKFCSLEGLGHFALLEDPHACASALLRMLNENVHG